MDAFEASQATIDEVFSAVDSSSHGLPSTEAARRLQCFGRNATLHADQQRSWYWQLLKAFNNPFVFVLLGLATVSLVTDDFAGALVLGTMALVSSSLAFWQEYRSSRAAEALRSLVHTQAVVSRIEAGARAQLSIDMELLVPGDMVSLSAGDLVPADGRVVASRHLHVNQATFTGESLPAEKAPTALPAGPAKSPQSPTNPVTDALELQNMCFMGTTVVSGSATLLVTATGPYTYFATLSKHALGKRPQTSFDQGVKQVTWLLIRFMAILVPIVFVINGFTKGDWYQAFYFGISVAVGLTPEMLPMIVTANLARGALVLSRCQVIVKQLSAIQNLGALDVLCTDKTGTLTADAVVLENHFDIRGQGSAVVLWHAYLNSFFQTGLRSLLDEAIITQAQRHEDWDVAQQYEVVDEIPFDFTRKRMSVVLKDKFATHGPTSKCTHLLVCKGAVEEVVSCCSRIQVNNNGDEEPLDAAATHQLYETVERYHREGERLIAVAYAKTPMKCDNKKYTVEDEAELTLMGFVSFLDPPKESAAAAVQALKAQGIELKVLTGDNELITRKVCKDIGLVVTGVLLGSDVAYFTDTELAETVAGVNVFAKLSPVQKCRIVQALRSNGCTLGFLGDGINDAPALKQADVGISVDTGTDIAKDAADIILLEKNLLVLERGVTEGRRTFVNIIKYMKMAASSNFGNVLSVVGASIMLPFLPMAPMQLLVQNLLYDLSQTAIPFDAVDPEYLSAPRRWAVPDLGRFMLCIGPISSVFDYSTFLLMWFVFGADDVKSTALFQSGWFVEGLLSQTLIVHMIRTSKVPFLESSPNPAVTIATVSVAIVGLCIPMTPLGTAIGLIPLPAEYYAWLCLILTAYCVLTQQLKRMYVRCFETWL
uniref:Magnesium-transporting ATPase, P-type 1 n=1 Tax=Eutreptiella gymnastica TaxID=73025 RepID=A0A7S4C7Z8_9EUGL